MQSSEGHIKETCLNRNRGKNEVYHQDGVRLHPPTLKSIQPFFRRALISMPQMLLLGGLLTVVQIHDAKQQPSRFLEAAVSGKLQRISQWQQQQLYGFPAIPAQP